MDFNKEVGEKIYSLRRARKMSRVDLGKKVNLHETTIKKYEDGNIKSLGTDKLKEFASALDTTVSYLMGWEEEKANNILTPIYYKKQIPILGRISAGLPLLAVEHIDGYENVDDESLDYGLIVKGDSMIGANIYEGYTVYVSRESDVCNGDIVIALINGYDATIKRFYKYDNEIILKPENPTMKEQHYKPEEVQLLGKVKQVKFNL